MTIYNKVAAHYEHGGLLAAIEEGFVALGKTPADATIEDLGPVDEFHIGGRVASAHFLGQLKISKDAHILDVGCGLGGGARFTAKTFGARVTGIDLTQEYIETGRALNGWVGLDEQVTLAQENALAMTFSSEIFDGAYMMHVGMNIEEKHTLFSDIFRVLNSGAYFGIYDIMRTAAGNLTYPVPWAAGSNTSFLAEAALYKKALIDAGFVICAEENRKEFAIEFFKAQKEKNRAHGAPPPLGLHTLMQQSTAEKVQNMVGNISNGLIAPVELIAQKL